MSDRISLFKNNIGNNFTTWTKRDTTESPTKERLFRNTEKKEKLYFEEDPKAKASTLSQALKQYIVDHRKYNVGECLKPAIMNEVTNNKKRNQ